MVDHNHDDPYLFLKRIPYALNDFIGDQIWRTYELRSIIFEETSTWVLNSDITEFFMTGSTTPSNTGANATVELTAAPIQPKEEKIELKQDFDRYLTRQIKRYKINESDNLLFVASERNSIFISESIVSDFAMKTGTEKNNLLSSLSLTDRVLKNNDREVVCFAYEFEVDEASVQSEKLYTLVVN